MKVIKNKFTRLAAFLIACVLVGVCSFRVFKLLIDDDRKNILDGTYRYTMSDAITDTYSKLWLIGNMYLRNLDENGKFSGSEYLEKSTISEMQTLGIMDENGKLKDIGDNNFEYYVSYGDQSFTNAPGKNIEDYKNSAYSVVNSGNSITLGESLHVWIPHYSWYMTNYGMTYYYYDKGLALFDFNTDGLDYYIDDNGAKIYFKTDGSTPVYDYREDDEYIEPTEVHIDYTIDQYYDENGNALTFEVLDENGDPIFTDIDGNLVRPEILYNEEYEPVDPDNYPYDIEQATESTEVPENNFYSIAESDGFELTLLIVPSDENIAAYEKADNEFNAQRKEFINSIIDMLPLALIVLVLTVFFLWTGGWSVSEKKYVLKSLNKIFTEVPIAVICILIAWIGYYFDNSYIIYDVKYVINELYLDVSTAGVCALVVTAIFGIAVLMLNTLIVKLKCKAFFKTSLTGKIASVIYKYAKKLYKKAESRFASRRELKNNAFAVRFITVSVIYAVLEILILIIGFDFNAFAPALIDSMILSAVYLVMVYSNISDITRLSAHIDSINEGNYEKQTVKPSSFVYPMTQKLNNISDGIQTAVDRQVQSERMKIDLVTNVSHDLKTPLTSIISYIDLLSAEELTPEARDYVTILEQKSEHLKAMVTDLFDLAKATSRTDVQLELIDAVILTGQVLGDLSDKINASGKEIRTNMKIDRAPVYAEGRKLYRVLQNLIDNALKYSLDGTRIYTNLSKEGENFLLQIKNISSYEMNFSPEEITERFTRADESRTTDGNGLGLSIAKSFTEACGGSFAVSVDGDVFTAEIRLPIVNTPEESEQN